MYMDGWGGGGLALCGHDGHLVVWLALGEQKKKFKAKLLFGSRF